MPTALSCVAVQAEQEDTPESTYQAQFDTVPGDWTTVRIPWREFVSVKRAQVENGAPVVDPAQVRQLGLVLSRFEYNGFANQNFRCAAPQAGRQRLTHVRHTLHGQRAARCVKDQSGGCCKACHASCS